MFSSKGTKQQHRVVSGPTNFVHVAHGDMNSAPQDFVISGQEEFRQLSLVGPSRSADDYIDYGWGPEEEEEEGEEDRASTHSASELPEAETTKIPLRKKIAKLVRSKLAERIKPMTRNAQIDTEASVRQRVSDPAPPKNTSTSNLNTSTSIPVLGSQAVTKSRAGPKLKKMVSQFFGR